MRKHHALARRLRQRQDDYLRFTRDPAVPFDNNAAERETRMSKLRIKVSGCMRSMTGAESFCAIRSYLSTAAKHRIGGLDALTRAAGGTPWMPEMTCKVPGASPACSTTRWGTPDGPAGLIAWLATDEAGWITGQVINSERLPLLGSVTRRGWRQLRALTGLAA